MRTTRWAIILMLASFPVIGAELDISKPFLCATIKVVECIDGGKCEEVLPEEVGAPEFMRINVKKKELLVEGHEPGRDEIHYIGELGTSLILQGTDEAAGEEGREGLGWTVSIEKTTGRMSAAASGRQTAFIVFGACTTLAR